MAAPVTDRVWDHSTADFDIFCTQGEVGFSDLINDNASIQRAIEIGTADVVRLFVEVRSKSGLVYGRAQTDALENVEHRQPFDILRLD